jgi:hypothetical protein
MEKEEKNKQDKQLAQNEKVKEFIESLGAECEGNKYLDDIFYQIDGYRYKCKYHDIKFTLYLDSSNVYIESTLKNSNDTEVFLKKLSETFNINLNKLRFSELTLKMFKLQSLPEEVVKLTADNDKVYLTTKDDNIYLSIDNNIHLLFDNTINRFVVLEIEDWVKYERVRGVIDGETREVFDKLYSSKTTFSLEFFEDDREKMIKLERNGKILQLLKKLTPIVNKIKRISIDITEDKILLNNNVLLELEEGWEVNIPVNDVEKLLGSDGVAVIEVHGDFWFIKVHRNYLEKVANALNVDTAYIINPRKSSPFIDLTKDYYMFTTPEFDYFYHYHIVPSVNVEKYFRSIGVNITMQSSTNSFEINNGDYKYTILKGEGDEVHVKVYRGDKLLNSLRTYLWYFGAKYFDELKSLDKEKLITVINRQFNERYFYPMPYDKVRQYVLTLIDNTINRIDEAIDAVKTRTPTFTKPIKNTDSIACIFDQNCEVTLELEEIGRLSSYYSLIATSKGHLPVPIFLEYAGIEGSSDEEDISITKNIIYFVRGYDKEIPEGEREEYLPDDNVRGTSSEVFEKAVVLYNKLLPNRRKLYYTEEKSRCVIEYDIDDEPECPDYALPDGFGYCRDFDYEPLMKKSEDELANEIIESLTEIREKMMKIREKMLQW